MDAQIANTVTSLHTLTFSMARPICSQYFHELSNLVLHNYNFIESKKDHK